MLLETVEKWLKPDLASGNKMIILPRKVLMHLAITTNAHPQEHLAVNDCVPVQMRVVCLCVHS